MADRLTEAMVELRSIRREMNTVEGQVLWFIDNRDSESLLSDPGYQSLERRAFELYRQEKELNAEIGRLDARAHEARMLTVLNDK